MDYPHRNWAKDQVEVGTMRLQNEHYFFREDTHRKERDLKSVFRVASNPLSPLPQLTVLDIELDQLPTNTNGW